MQLSKFRRSVAAVAAAAVAFGGLALALPASAAPIIRDIDTTADLTIHKFEYDAKDRGKSDGLFKEPTGLTGLKPMGGIEFQVQQVPDVDLSTNAGWQAVGDLTADAAKDRVDGLPVLPNQLQTTESDGTTKFEDLPIGLYLVSENLTPAQIAAGITAIESPFLVTLPLTHPTELDTWIYDVHVYPKNRVTDAPVKTVSDDDGSTLAVGDDIEWTITAPIPVGTLSAFGIRDVLSGHLSHTDTAVSVTLGDIALEPGDYTVIDARPGGDPEGNTNTVIVDFTEDGLRRLENIREANVAAEVEAEVEVVLTTKVESLPSNGVIANEAALFPNDSYNIYEPTDRGVPSDEVKSKFGNLNITKKNQEGDLLSGAEFQVFASKEHALAGTPAIVIDKKSTWTTGEDDEDDGLVTIKGLRASNWANGALVAEEADYQTYWLLETKSPEGYELLAEPVEFTVLANENEAIISVRETTIINVPENGGFELPLTGGAGTALFTIIGLTLVAGAGVVLARSRKTATK